MPVGGECKARDIDAGQTHRASLGGGEMRVPLYRTYVLVQGASFFYPECRSPGHINAAYSPDRHPAPLVDEQHLRPGTPDRLSRLYCQERHRDMILRRERTLRRAAVAPHP